MHLNIIARYLEARRRAAAHRHAPRPSVSLPTQNFSVKRTRRADQRGHTKQHAFPSLEKPSHNVCTFSSSVLPRVSVAKAPRSGSSRRAPARRSRFATYSASALKRVKSIARSREKATDTVPLLDDDFAFPSSKAKARHAMTRRSTFVDAMPTFSNRAHESSPALTHDGLEASRMMQRPATVAVEARSRTRMSAYSPSRFFRKSPTTPRQTHARTPSSSRRRRSLTFPFSTQAHHQKTPLSISLPRTSEADQAGNCPTCGYDRRTCPCDLTRQRALSSVDEQDKKRAQEMSQRARKDSQASRRRSVSSLGRGVNSSPRMGVGPPLPSRPIAIERDRTDSEASDVNPFLEPRRPRKQSGLLGSPLKLVENFDQPTSSSSYETSDVFAQHQDAQHTPQRQGNPTQQQSMKHSIDMQDPATLALLDFFGPSLLSSPRTPAAPPSTWSSPSVYADDHEDKRRTIGDASFWSASESQQTLGRGLMYSPAPSSAFGLALSVGFPSGMDLSAIQEAEMESTDTQANRRDEGRDNQTNTSHAPQLQLLPATLDRLSMSSPTPDGLTLEAITDDSTETRTTDPDVKADQRGTEAESPKDCFLAPLQVPPLHRGPQRSSPVPYFITRFEGDSRSAAGTNPFKTSGAANRRQNTINSSLSTQGWSKKDTAAARSSATIIAPTGQATNPFLDPLTNDLGATHLTADQASTDPSYFLNCSSMMSGDQTGPSNFLNCCTTVSEPTSVSDFLDCCSTVSGDRSGPSSSLNYSSTVSRAPTNPSDLIDFTSTTAESLTLMAATTTTVCSTSASTVSMRTSNDNEDHSRAQSQTTASPASASSSILSPYYSPTTSPSTSIPTSTASSCSWSTSWKILLQERDNSASSTSASEAGEEVLTNILPFPPSRSQGQQGGQFPNTYRSATDLILREYTGM